MAEMNINDDKYDFLSVDKMKKLNKKVNHLVDDQAQQPQPEPEAVTDNEDIPFSTDRYESYTVNPNEISEDLLHQLADIIDKKSYYNENDFSDSSIKGPNTTDRILNSIAVAYVMEEGLPVAVATLLDPTVENYKGIIPSDYYELKSGRSMENKIQQEFFAVKPEYHNRGFAQELKRLLLETAPAMFIINPVSDKETSTGLFKNGYKLVARFDTEWESEPVELWIN